MHQHLHLVLHAVGEVFEELCAILRINLHIVQVYIRLLGVGDAMAIDLQEEFQKLPRRQEFRYHRRGQDIAYVLRGNGAAGAVILFQTEAAAVCGDVLIQTVEKGGLTGTVAAQQTIDPPLFKGKRGTFQNFFFVKFLLQVFNDKFHGKTPHRGIRWVRSL